MAALTNIKQGFGNKLLMLWNRLQIVNKKGILYVLVVKSHHEDGNKDEELTSIFPKLKDCPWIKFIDSWKEYDALKKTEEEIVPDYNFDNSRVDGFKSYFTFAPSFSHLLKEYDMKNGIFLHYRLGDKVKIFDKYLVMKPSYFKDNIEKMLKDHVGPIYLLSDTPKLAHKLIPEAELLDLTWMETFYLLAKCKRGIFSESTFGVAAACLNTDFKIVFPGYHVIIKTGKLTSKVWGPPFQYEHKNYRVTQKSDLI